MQSSKIKPLIPRVLLSLILAILIWYSINGNSGNINTRYIMNIPVILTNSDELHNKGLTLQNNVSYYVNIQLRGTETSLDQISPSDLNAQINLGQIDSNGVQSLPVIVSGLNNTVILDQTVPSTIELDVEKITEKEFQPTILTQGKPQTGFSVISSSTTEVVNISGPDEQVNQTASISGVANVDGLSGNSYQFVSLQAYDSDGNILNEVVITPNVVEAEILIGVTKQVNLEVPIVNNAPAQGYKLNSISVSPKSIRIAGNVDEVNSIETLHVNSVTIPDATNDHTFSLNSNIIVPDGISLIGSDAVASVELGIEKVNEKVFNIINFDFIGLSPGLEVDRINPGSVTVTLSGTISELSKIDNSEVKGVLDLTGLGEGQYVVPVIMNIEETSILSLEPQNVEVTIISD